MVDNCERPTRDSNDAGLRYAKEDCLGRLPLTPVWFPLEPNSFGDFGANLSSTQREVINPTRQRPKGMITGLDASANWQMDLLPNNHLPFVEASLYAVARANASTVTDGVVTPVTAVADDAGYASTLSAQFVVGDIIHAQGFNQPANNGLKVVANGTAGNINTTGLVDEALPPNTATVQRAGYQFTAGDFKFVVTGALVTATTTTKDMTTLGIIPGQWVYVGGDALTTRSEINYGFARVRSVTTNVLTFDKVNWIDAVSDAAAGKTIRLFTGIVVKNESQKSLIQRIPLQFERTLGEDSDGTMAEYVIGGMLNEISFNLATEDKATMDLSFVALDADPRSGADGLKGGVRPMLVTGQSAFNTASDIIRIAMSEVNPATSTPEPLFALVTEMTLTFGNNLNGVKALGVLGSADITTGMLDAGGSLTAYFQDMRATKAVRQNKTVSLDAILVRDNSGIAFDIPALTLGNGSAAVTPNEPITLPLDMSGSESEFGHTVMYVNFPYLPTIASTKNTI